jgi:hypothetical protein
MAVIHDMDDTVKEILTASECNGTSEGSLGTANQLALAAGDVHSIAVNALTKNTGSDDESLLSGLQHLEDQHLVTGEEAAILRQIVTIVLSDKLPTEIADQVRQLYETLREVHPSPVALMIASIVADSTRTAAAESEI